MRLVDKGIVALFALTFLADVSIAVSQTTPDQAPPAAPTTTLRTDVRLVVVDVMVVDKNGASVKGLKAEDFVLKEDKVPQKIASVDDHTGNRRDNFVVKPVVSEAGTTVLTNKPVNAPTVWNVLLVDLLNTQIADQARMRTQVQQFVKSSATRPAACARCHARRTEAAGSFSWRSRSDRQNPDHKRDVSHAVASAGHLQLRRRSVTSKR